MAVVEQVGVAPAAFVDGNTIVVDHLVATSPEAALSAQAFAERIGQRNVARHVEALIDIGGKAVAIGSSTMDVDEIKRSLDRFTDRVETSAESSVKELREAVETATNTESGSIGQSVTRAMTELAQRLDTLLKGEDSPVRLAIGHTVKGLMDQALEEMQRTIKAHENSVRTVLSTDSPDSPLSGLKRELLQAERDGRREIEERLGRIQELIAVGQEHQAVMAKTAIKGLDYEASVVQALTLVAHGLEDTVEPTGGVAGAIPRCKVGDAVITVNGIAGHGQSIKIVMEAKDTKLTPDKWRAELDQARKNRLASAALGVAKVCDHIPGGERIFILDPTHIVLAYDPAEDDPALLYTVYHLLRAHAAALVLNDTGDALDINALHTSLAGALEMLEEFSKIDKAVNNARTQLGTIEATAQRMSGSLHTSLRQANEMLEGSAT